MGDPKSGQVALGPLIDAKQRDRVHSMVTDTVGAGATLLAGGTFEELFYRPTVLTDVPTTSRGLRRRGLRPRRAGRLLRVPRRRGGPRRRPAPTDSRWESCPATACGHWNWPVVFPTGAIHINDQTVADEAVIPFGGMGSSGNGSRMGGLSNLDAYTETQWVTAQSEMPEYPF